jgi:hypothetical protein
MYLFGILIHLDINLFYFHNLNIFLVYLKQIFSFFFVMSWLIIFCNFHIFVLITIETNFITAQWPFIILIFFLQFLILHIYLNVFIKNILKSSSFRVRRCISVI